MLLPKFDHRFSPIASFTGLFADTESVLIKAGSAPPRMSMLQPKPSTERVKQHGVSYVVPLLLRLPGLKQTDQRLEISRPNLTRL